MSASSNLSRASILIGLSACAALAGGLDRARLHAFYQDGEFDRLIAALEDYGKGRCSCSRADSLFAEKHLAVVLAANPATRELGRYHMHRLLDLAPRADLLDMYVGEEVDAVFEKVRKEHSILSTAAPASDRPRSPAAPARTRASGAPREAAAPGHPGPAGSRPGPSAPAQRVARAAAPSKAIAPAPSGAAAVPASAALSVGPSRYSDAWAVLPAAQAVPAPAAPSPARATARAEGPRPSWDRLPGDGAGPEADLAADPDEAARAAGIRERARPAKAGGPDPKETGTAREAAGTGPDRDSRRVWKEAGLWIGGGAALAAVAFALWQAGSGDGEPGKTYDVPASVSR